jgi:hypothetical protein
MSGCPLGVGAPGVDAAQLAAAAARDVMETFPDDARPAALTAAGSAHGPNPGPAPLCDLTRYRTCPAGLAKACWCGVEGTTVSDDGLGFKSWCVCCRVSIGVQFFLTADGEVQSVHARRRPQRVHANMLKLAGTVGGNPLW